MWRLKAGLVAKQNLSCLFNNIYYNPFQKNNLARLPEPGLQPDSLFPDNYKENDPEIL